MEKKNYKPKESIIAAQWNPDPAKGKYIGAKKIWGCIEENSIDEYGVNYTPQYPWIQSQLGPMGLEENDYIVYDTAGNVMTVLPPDLFDETYEPC